jgi:glycine/D-amino acid oxidase-like deaminating enzyme
VFAPGPLLARALSLAGLEAPVFCELHAKLALDDPAGIVPRELPMTLWDDPVSLEWSDQERVALRRDPGARGLARPLPRGVHVRPRGSGTEVLLIWTYDTRPTPPDWPPRFDPLYGEILVRGAARMIPGLRAYFGRGGKGVVSGGYYCKTRENRPLIGPLPLEGAFVIGALSGYGIMASQAAAELAAAHVTGDPLPAHAPAFLPSRYDDPEYVARIEAYRGWSGQL